MYERDDRLGGLLRYGIPEFKMEKKVLDRRLAQLREEGTRFVTGCEVGGSKPGDLSVETLRASFDAVVLAVGALRGRDAPDVPGPVAERRAPGDGAPGAGEQGVRGRRPDVDLRARASTCIVIGGGDTGADCYGTATRQGALSVTQLDQYPQPPDDARRRPLAVAGVAVDPADLPRARGGGGAAVRGGGGGVRRTTAPATSKAVRLREVVRAQGPGDRRPRGGRRSATRSRSCRRTWSCWRSASRAWSTCRCSTAWACR